MKTTILTFALALATMPLTFAKTQAAAPATGRHRFQAGRRGDREDHQEACQESGQEDREAGRQQHRGTGETVVRDFFRKPRWRVCSRQRGFLFL